MTDTAHQVLLEIKESVGIIQLNRPEKLNAISQQMMAEIVEATKSYDANPSIGCIIITGNEKAFAAGADIEQMAVATTQEMLSQDPFYMWDQIAATKKPIISVVSGYCFGGGCELSLMCDLIVASETAVFAQPEINLGIIPGAGGTQRLIKRVGLNKAMQLILTGDKVKAAEAKSIGLVAEVYTQATYFEDALTLAKTIASKPRLATQLAKKLIWQSYNLDTETGIKVERQAFYALFDSDDKNEGMKAFLEKRPAVFQHQK